MPTNTFELITSGTLGSTSTYIQFTGIPQTYTHLLIKCYVHSNRSAGNDGGWEITYNSNAFTGSSFTYTQFYCAGVSGNALSGTSSTGTGGAVGVGTSQDTQNANLFSPWNGFLSNYSNTGTVKSGFLQSSNNPPSVSGVDASGLSTWQFNSTTAVSSIYLRTNGGSSSFVAGSTYYLYGLK